MAQVPVSVVMPCFRCARSVTEAVRSAREQSASPLELIAVDDGSDDETHEVLLALQRTHGIERMRLIRFERNRGAAAARNAGWAAARGEFVAFLDADATWHPRKLEIQYRYMEQHPEVVVCGTLHLVTTGSIGLESIFDELQVRPVGFRNLLWRNRFITSSAMVRRDLRQRFQEGQRHMEDHRLWLEVARAGHQIARIEMPLAAHHKPDFGAGGLSKDLAAMEKAELGNYRALYRAGSIQGLTLAALCVWSLAKYVRRLVVVALRRPKG